MNSIIQLIHFSTWLIGSKYYIGRSYWSRSSNNWHRWSSNGYTCLIPSLKSWWGCFGRMVWKNGTQPCGAYLDILKIEDSNRWTCLLCHPPDFSIYIGIETNGNHTEAWIDRRNHVLYEGNFFSATNVENVSKSRVKQDWKLFSLHAELKLSRI